MIAVPLLVYTTGCFARNVLPFCRRGKSFKVLERSTVQGHVGCPNNSAKAEECFLIDLVSAEQIGTVAEISQKPIQLPQGSLSAIQPPRKRSCCKRLRLENDKANGQERFLRVPAIRTSINANKEQAFEKTFPILLP